MVRRALFSHSIHFHFIYLFISGFIARASHDKQNILILSRLFVCRQRHGGGRKKELINKRRRRFYEFLSHLNYLSKISSNSRLYCMRRTKKLNEIIRGKSLFDVRRQIGDELGGSWIACAVAGDTCCVGFEENKQCLVMCC